MTALLSEIRAEIAAEGPISVERYMALCLGHPVHGYYMTRDPFGPAGDFTTAPEISQMFGELLGLWAAQVWSDMGSPPILRLVELGPGRGTLMADMLRAARVAPGFLDAACVHLVETSPILQAAQRLRLEAAPALVAWHDRFNDVPEGPAVIVANEFFDALPIRQFVRAETGWHERLVGFGGDDDQILAFGLAPDADPRLTLDAPEGAVVEWPRAGFEVASAIARRLGRHPGAALVIDYGPLRSGLGDSFQAVKAHQFADPLEEPGEADLTAHVPFEALAQTVAGQAADVHGPLCQGDFLRAIGIAARAQTLRARADATQTQALDIALERLAGEGTESMGELFKVIAFSSRGLRLPGFAEARSAEPAPAAAAS